MRLMRNIKRVSNYIDEIDDGNGFSVSNITVEHRNNNPKRDYVFVNKVQCKHIPADPLDMIDMCKKLAKLVNEKLEDNRKVLVVGFAETATAIGNVVADNLHSCRYVMVTTREEVKGSRQLITFEEEHSHATTQKLLTYNDSRAVNLEDFDYVLFVEDEISTGNTILNFINAFEKVHSGLKYGVASVCNWQSIEDIKKFSDRNIDRFALITGKLRNKNTKMFSETDLAYKQDIDEIGSDEPGDYDEGVINREDTELFIEERLGHLPNRDLDNIIEQIKPLIPEGTETVRIIGTEEFMYIPIKVGEYIRKELGLDVICHSTTRSVIDAVHDESSGTADSIKVAYKLKVYDSSRKIRLYNISEITDLVLFITDVELSENQKDDIAHRIMHNTGSYNILCLKSR